MRFALLLFAMLLAGCDRGESTQPIEIGHVHPSGASDDEFRAIKLAVEIHNRGEGRRIHVRHAPGGTTAEEWGAQASRLFALNGVKGLVGGRRAREAERIGAALAGEKALAICPAGWAGPNAPPQLFTVGLAPAERARVLANLVREAKPKQILIVRDPAAACANHTADLFAAELRDFAIVEQDLASPRKLDVGVVFYACSAAAALHHRESLPNAPLLLFGDEDAELPTLFHGGPSGNGFMVATPFDSSASTERLNAFAASYREAYQQPLSLAAVLAYDAFSLWVEAFRRAKGHDSGAMRDQLHEPSLESLTGPFAFAADNTARRPIFVGKVVGAQLTEVRRLEPGK